MSSRAAGRRAFAAVVVLPSMCRLMAAWDERPGNAAGERRSRWRICRRRPEWHHARVSAVVAGFTAFRMRLPIAVTPKRVRLRGDGSLSRRLCEAATGTGGARYCPLSRVDDRARTTTCECGSSSETS